MILNKEKAKIKQIQILNITANNYYNKRHVAYKCGRKVRI